MNKLYYIFGLGLVLSLGVSCIGDDVIEDYVEPIIRIGEGIDTLGLNTSHQLSATYFNNIGQRESSASIVWMSDASSIVSVSETGLLEGKAEGAATISASVVTQSSIVRESLNIYVGGNTTIAPEGTMRKGTLSTTSSYILQGSVVLEEGADGNLMLNLGADYSATTALPGLYVYLSNNPRTINDALEVGAVKVFSGAHSYTLPSSVNLTDYAYVLYFCKPFNVKVGDGTLGDPE